MGETKTVKGRFDGKRVILLDEPPTREPCEVTVAFGAREDDEEAHREFLAARGAWVDSRSTDEPWTGERRDVTVMFPGVGLDPAERRRRFLSALGSWDDARSTDEIMADIKASSHLTREVPEL
jgi:hypothetical protein